MTTVAADVACHTCHTAAGTVLLADQPHCATCAHSWLLLHLYTVAADQAHTAGRPHTARLLLALAEQEAYRLDGRST